jgi:ribosomal protein S18 acetylase RimI-like enzyme
MPITLRRATVDDAAALSMLGARLFEQTFGPNNTASNMQDYLVHAFTPEKQTSELEHPDRAVWLAMDDTGELVGYASLLVGSVIEGVQASKPAEVERIYADRSMHGSGLGSQLMEACVEHAMRSGCDVLWLAVWEHNPRAIAFYERRGFARVGAKTFRLGADLQRDYVMSRPLA